MSQNTSTLFRVAGGISLALLVVQSVSPGQSAAPPKGKPAAGKAAEDKTLQRVFRLKHIAASEASQILRQLLGDAVGSRGSVRIASDVRTNSLFVFGTTAKLDEIMLDSGRKMVVAYADQATLERIHLLLESLGNQRQQKPAATVRDLQVRIFWLVSGRDRKAQGLPENLKQLAGELSRQGMDRPHLATQVMISTEIGGRFETAASVDLAGLHELSISGTTTDKKDRIGLSLTVSVNQSSPRRSSRRVASLRTQVAVPLDHPVVLGVTPSDAMTSAFVVQVVRRKPGVLSGFEFKDASWKQVFRWLTEQTEKPVIASFTPTGTFSFSGPANRTYTLGEVIDIINDGLAANSATQKYLLIRRERNFVLVPADEKVDQTLLPRVSATELDERGKSEYVSVTIQLKTIGAEEIVTDVKKMLSPFGEVLALTKLNQLVVSDRAENLRRIWQILKEIEQKETK